MLQIHINIYRPQCTRFHTLQQYPFINLPKRKIGKYNHQAKTKRSFMRALRIESRIYRKPHEPMKNKIHINLWVTIWTIYKFQAFKRPYYAKSRR